MHLLLSLLPAFTTLYGKDDGTLCLLLSNSQQLKKNPKALSPLTPCCTVSNPNKVNMNTPFSFELVQLEQFGRLGS
jgi:hypothetical protein